MSTERYNRQVLVWGEENQKKLEETHVLIRGSGTLAQCVLLNYAGLGVGNITLVDDARLTIHDTNEVLINPHETGKAKANLITEALKRINPLLTLTPITAAFEPALLFETYNFIVDVTNNPTSQHQTLRYARDRDITAIIAATNADKGSIICCDPRSAANLEDLVLSDYAKQPQGNTTSGVIAGLIADETRKHVFTITALPNFNAPDPHNSPIPLSTDKPLPPNKTFTYALQSFFSGRTPLKNQPRNVLIVGAGAIGNYTTLQLTLNCTPAIDLVDFDTIEETNLNRQPFLAGHIGENKANVLAECMKTINPLVMIHPITDKFTAATFLKRNTKYDLIIGCVDNALARYELSTYARRTYTPYLDGGVSEFTGQAAMHLPPKNPCISCQQHLYDVVKNETRQQKQQLQQHGCATANPSIVIPHAVISGILADEAIHLPRKTSIPYPTLHFSSLSSTRFSVEPTPLTPCPCYKEYLLLTHQESPKR